MPSGDSGPLVLFSIVQVLSLAPGNYGRLEVDCRDLFRSLEEVLSYQTRPEISHYEHCGLGAYPPSEVEIRRVKRKDCDCI